MSEQNYHEQTLQILTQIGIYMRQHDEGQAKGHLTMAIMRCQKAGCGDDLAQALMRGVFPIDETNGATSSPD